MNRLVLAALTALAVALPIVGTSSATATAADETGWPTALSVDVSPGRAPAYGDAVEISGQVLWAPEGDNEALEGVPVELLRKWRGTDAWVSLGTVTTGEPSAAGFDGATFAFTVEATRNVTYRLSYDGTPPPGSEDTFGPAQVFPRLAVHRHLNVKWKHAGEDYFLAGDVDPGWEKRPVVMERQQCGHCAWKVFAKDRSSSTGAFRLPVAFPKKAGTWSFRAMVPGGKEFAPSYSRVHQAVTTR